MLIDPEGGRSSMKRTAKSVQREGFARIRFALSAKRVYLGRVAVISINSSRNEQYFITRLMGEEDIRLGKGPRLRNG